MDDMDTIEKRITLQAPISRVWRALTDAEEFGQWFGIRLDGPFVVGQRMRGTFDAKMDPAAIQAYQARLGLAPSEIRMPPPNTVFCTVERMEPEHTFAYRWVPYGLDAEADPEREPTTLVQFRLDAAGEGTRLTIVESGFSRVPAHRRERAFRMNEGGWAGQSQNLARHVDAR